MFHAIQLQDPNHASFLHNIMRRSVADEASVQIEKDRKNGATGAILFLPPAQNPETELPTVRRGEFIGLTESGFHWAVIIAESNLDERGRIPFWSIPVEDLQLV